MADFAAESMMGCLAEDGGAGARCLAQAEAARALLRTEGWEACPGTSGAPNQDVGLGDWPHGWQFHALRTRNVSFRDAGEW